MTVTNNVVPFVDLQTQYRIIQGELEQAILRVMQESSFILGRELELFESEFAGFCGTRNGVGVDTGLSALELALRASNIGPGDEVITAANTFIATAFAISHAGARPVLVDIDPETYTMDIAQLRSAIGARTAAIIPVHLYGHPADMQPILEIARQHHLVVIEDACQAHGAEYRGRRVGSFGDAAAFSFYPGKNLGAAGDGGMMVTNNAQLAERVRILRNYGQKEKYVHLIKGHNRRLDTLQAAVLAVKLKYLELWNQERRNHANDYSAALEGSGVITPASAGYALPVWHLYVVRTNRRSELASFLHKRGVQTGVHYPIPIHLQIAYKDLGYRRGDFPVTEAYSEEILSLPMYPELQRESIQYIAAAIRQFNAQYQISEPAVA